MARYTCPICHSAVREDAWQRYGACADETHAILAAKLREAYGYSVRKQFWLRDCADCGKAFCAPGKVIYCEEHQAEYLRLLSLERYWADRDARAADYEKACIACGKTFTAKRVDAQWCSPECRTRKYPSVCDVCGTDYMAATADSKYCSMPCVGESRRVHANKKERYYVKTLNRRARMLEAYVEDVTPSVVFERDNWTCRLCGEQVDRSLHGWDRMAATVDHVIPLNAGGKHCYSNVQTAHRACNSSKSDKWQGQLSLV